MPTLTLFNTEKEEVGSVSLADKVFGATVREHLFYEAVRYQLAKRRAGTHATKGRASVSGGGKKPFRQKGTGRARAGTTRAPHWRGGGVAHGPHPRSHALQMNKKARKAALCSALSRRCEENALTIFDDIQMEEIKTKRFKGIMNAFDFQDLLLIVPTYEGDSKEDRSAHEAKYDRVYRAGRNLPKVTVMSVNGLNVYDILKHQNLAMTKAAAQQVASRLEK
ncbi:MAG: 50S ribosomal protein L4 [Myxococcota bacterium]|nr:50S ribosomal protein L4 [Myxococcota bacterium]